MNFDLRTAQIPKWAMLLMAGLTAITILLNVMPFAQHIFISYDGDSVYAAKQNQFAGAPVPLNDEIARQSH